MQNGTSSSSIWNGTLRFNDQIITNVEMRSEFKETTKPYLLGDTLEVDQLITWADVLDQKLIDEIASSTDLCRKLIHSPCVEVKLRKMNNVQYFYTSYFTLSCPNSGAFTQIHNTLRRSQYAGLSILPNGAIFLLIPNGELSNFLTLPINNSYPIFHCLMITLGPMGPLTENDAASLLNSQRKLDPREDELVCPRSKTMAKVAQFNAEWGNRLHSGGGDKASDPATSSSSASGHYGSGSRPSTPTNAATAGKFNHHHHPIGFPTRPVEEIAAGNGGGHRVPGYSASGFTSSLPRESGAQPSSHVTNFSASTGYDKNRDLFKQTLQNIKNVGKDQLPTDPRISNVSSFDSRQAGNSSSAGSSSSNIAAFPPNVLRDPRLRRIANNDPQSVSRIMGLEPSKPSESGTTTSSAIGDLNRPYSPSQTMRTMSPVPTSTTSSSISGERTPIRPKTTRGVPPPVINIPLERVETIDSGIITPSKFFADISAITNDSMNIFAGSFATSTPKIVEPKVKTGLNFDILNWNARELQAEEEAARRSVTPQPAAAVSDDSPASPSEAQRTISANDATLIPLTKQDDDDEESPQLRIADDEEPASPLSRTAASQSTVPLPPFSEAKATEKKLSASEDAKAEKSIETDDPMDISMSEDDNAANQALNGHSRDANAVVKTESCGGRAEEKLATTKSAKESAAGRLSPCDIKAQLPPPGVIDAPRVAGVLPPNTPRPRTTLLPFSTPTPSMSAGFVPPPPFSGSAPPFGSAGPFGVYPHVPYSGFFGDFTSSLLNVASQPSLRTVNQLRPFMNNNNGSTKKSQTIDPDKQKNLAQQAVSVFNRSPPKTPAACAKAPEAIPIPSPAQSTPYAVAAQTTASADTGTPEPSTKKSETSYGKETSEATFIPHSLGIAFLPDDDTDTS